jgi:hypothetical protein
MRSSSAHSGSDQAAGVLGGGAEAEEVIAAAGVQYVGQANCQEHATKGSGEERDIRVGGEGAWWHCGLAFVVTVCMR